jgi:hypothetical protein
MKNTNALVLSGAATGNVTGTAIDGSQMYQASFQVISGDAAVAGTVKIQMSNDLQPQGTFNPSAYTNWSDIPSATSTVVAGSGPPIILSVVSARAIRVVFTRTGGATTIKVNMFSINI